MNLLNSEDTNISLFCDNIISAGFIPTITSPTRYNPIHNTASLIDNIVLKSKDIINFSSTILTSKISDHFGCITSIPIFHFNKKDKLPPKKVKVVDYSEKNILKFKQNIEKQNLCMLLLNNDSDNPNDTYELFEKIICETRNNTFPSKTVRFDRHKHMHQPWMSKGILISINFRDDLYLKYLNAPLNSQSRFSLKISLDEYNRIFKRAINTAKEIYYKKLFVNYKLDMRKTWKSINILFGRASKKSTLPDSFIINDVSVSDNLTIANCFNKFFTQIGENLANEIGDSVHSFSSYLKNKISHNFSFHQADPESVGKVIDSLATKTSCGYDNISTKFLKSIKDVIVDPLTIIINQVLLRRVFFRIN